MVRVADYIMEKLSDAGAEHLFMVTGRGILYLSDAAAKNENITCVPMHHEQACAYAAMAYSSYNDRIGACLVSTGCAGTNAVTGVLCAWQDGIPMVVVSGQNTLRETSRHSGIPLRTWGQQEADIISLVQPITKYAVMLESADKAVYEVEKALYMANNGRKGPVWIDVPLDIQNMRIEPDELEHFIPEEAAAVPSEEDISELKVLLERSERPVILFGSGIRHSGASAELVSFAEKNNIPVAYSASAPDIIPYGHRLCMGSVGMMACSRSGCFAVQNSDLLIVIGSRLSPMTTGGEYGKFAREAAVVVIDIDEVEHSKNTVKIDKFIKADAKLSLLKLITFDLSGKYDKWSEKCAEWKKLFPLCEAPRTTGTKTDLYYLADRLSLTMPSDSVFVADAGLEELILPSNIDFSDGRRCIHPASQGAMGFALPASIGAYYSSGKKDVIAVIGDGSVMMNLQELTTITYNNIPIKLLIINNNAYSVIRKRQTDLFRTRTVGTDPANGVGCPDFKKVAECFGFEYIRIEDSKELDSGLEMVYSLTKPVICEIMSPEDQDYICCAFARNSEKKFVMRPLEDQAPFMDRELFLKEMIVEPIDQ